MLPWKRFQLTSCKPQFCQSILVMRLTEESVTSFGVRVQRSGRFILLAGSTFVCQKAKVVWV
ncbi:hypothetical protein LINPERHAP1_LOCUS17933 [Linum perenne]